MSKPQTKSKGIKVKNVVFHQALAVPGITAQTLNQSKAPGVEMNLLPQGLHIEYKKKTFLAPIPNIVYMELEEAMNKED